MSVRLEPTSDSGDIEATSSARGGYTIGKHHWSKIKRQWPAAVCCALYIVLAMIVYGHFSSLGPSHMTGSLSSDAIEQVWWLAWTAFALPHGHNVFLAQWLNYPDGQNFGVNTSMLALGVLFMPITKLFGPVVTWNIAMRVAVALSASSMCLVLRRWTTWWPAAFVGGLTYGLSGYMAYFVGSSDLFLACVPLPPVILLLLHEILERQRWRPGRTGGLLGLLCALQFFIWPEVLVGTVVMGAIAIALLLLIYRRTLRERWRYMRTAFGYSLGVAGLLIFYPLLLTYAGPQSLKGGTPVSLSALTLNPSDSLGAIVPSSEWLSTTRLTALTHQWFGSASALYLGVPLVLALASFAVFLRKRRTILFAGVLALIAFALSLGPRLWVDGHETRIRLPFVVFEHLPVVASFVPVRFSLYTALFAAGMFAIGIDELWRRIRLSGSPRWLSQRWRTVAAVGALAAISAAAVVPLVPRHTQPTTPTNVPSLFTSAAVEAIPGGSVVLAYPYPDQSGGLLFQPPKNVMLDQAVAGMRFKLIGGYGWFPLPAGRPGGSFSPSILKPETVQTIFDTAFHGDGSGTSPLSQGNLTALRVFLRKYDVQTVIVLPRATDAAAVVSYVTAVIGSPVESGGVTAWFHVKQRLRVDRVHLAPVGSDNRATFLNAVSDVVEPANGARLSGSTVLDARATGYFKLTQVKFYLTGVTHHNALDRYRHRYSFRVVHALEHDHRRQRQVPATERCLRRWRVQRYKCRCLHHSLKLTRAFAG